VVAVPRVTSEQAEEIALRHYGVNGSAERLATEHDDTFRLTTRAGHSRLLKISPEHADQLLAVLSDVLTATGPGDQ
jgi:Ser/Thr protein kinase RdoA (MazF antagonist)